MFMIRSGGSWFIVREEIFILHRVSSLSDELLLRKTQLVSCGVSRPVHWPYPLSSGFSSLDTQSLNRLCIIHEYRLPPLNRTVNGMLGEQLRRDVRVHCGSEISPFVK